MRASSTGPFWKPPPPERGDLRKFGLLFAALATALAGYLAWRRGLPDATVPGLIAAALLLVSVAMPSVLKPAWWPWMVLSRVLGFINSHLLLALVFYLLFTPIGLVMRLFGRDPLGDRDFRKARQSALEGGSLWVPRETPQLPRHHYLRQF
jgi:hypothetical protein